MACLYLRDAKGDMAFFGCSAFDSQCAIKQVKESQAGSIREKCVFRITTAAIANCAAGCCSCGQSWNILVCSECEVPLLHLCCSSCTPRHSAQTAAAAVLLQVPSQRKQRTPLHKHPAGSHQHCRESAHHGCIAGQQGIVVVWHQPLLRAAWVAGEGKASWAAAGVAHCVHCGTLRPNMGRTVPRTPRALHRLTLRKLVVSNSRLLTRT